MPSKQFIEEYPLYRKFSFDVPDTLDGLPEVAINMECPECKSKQTFRMTNHYYGSHPHSVQLSEGACVRALYICSHCQKFVRSFFMKIADNGKWIMKIGQYPPWDINLDSGLMQMLGEHSSYYKKGLICESQSFGIGAYGYYRRVIEDTIDNLLDEIPNLLGGKELTAYKQALDQTKKTIVTRDKIDLVKDLLPPILRPDGINPLAVLHSTLSEGLHSESDEACLEHAATCRDTLVFLVNQVLTSKAASEKYTEGVRKLLNKKAKKGMAQK